MSVLIDLRSAHAVCPDLSNKEHPSRAVQFLVENEKKTIEIKRLVMYQLFTLLLFL